MQRRLTTILSADVAGYSRLMERDEAGTLAELMERQATIIDPLMAGFGGRIIKTLGDGFLAEFESPSSAVSFAADMQQACEARNASIAEERRMSFRIGIHLADVIFDRNDAFGEGVNVATRLQAIAEPGSIFLSETVHEHVRDNVLLTQACRVAASPAPTAPHNAGDLSGFDCRAALRQHEWRSRTGLFQRRHHRGHHH